MNALDLTIVVAAVAAALGGWRIGVVGRVFAWLGVALGLLLAIPLVAPVVARFGGEESDTRVTVALLLLLLCGAGGQAIGILVSLALQRRGAMRPLSRTERIGGAALGATGVLALVWMLLPSLAAAPGWPARASRDSAIVTLIRERAPTPPDAFDAWGRAIADAPYPAALDPLAAPPDPGAPPAETLDPATIATARAAAVRVSGVACASVQDGSGTVVGPELVITNAHVVAGEQATTVTDADGVDRTGIVVRFDPLRDLAVVRVADLDAEPLALGDAEPEALASVFGYPGGGELRVAPTRVGETIEARGTDIYRDQPSSRRVLVLAARLAPGDSGAGVVDTNGRLIGVAFAVDPGSSTTAYALARSEIEATLASAEGAFTAADTGPCLAD